MIEIPEATVLARQIRETLTGKQIEEVIAAHSPHKFAWYNGDPCDYHGLLSLQTITGAVAYGGQVEIRADGMCILFSDGVNLRYHHKEAKRPSKHQLLIEFTDGSGLSASVQMYGGLCCFREGGYDNSYYLQAKTKPNPLLEAFSRDYFTTIIHAAGADKLSLKALLATEQRIPGLGNGVLQDILYNAQLHPKKKALSLSLEDEDRLFQALKETLQSMACRGGRDTEKDLFGNPGGYRTRLSKNTAGKPCAVCGNHIKKEAYMGGSIYYCPGCQKM